MFGLYRYTWLLFVYGIKLFLWVWGLLSWPANSLQAYIASLERNSLPITDPSVTRQPTMGSCCSVDQEACSCPCDNTECKKKEERTSLINSHGDQFHCKWCLKHCPACKRCTEYCEGPVCRRFRELEEEFSKKERKHKDELSRAKEQIDDLSSKLFEKGTKTSFECRSDKTAPTVIARKFDDIYKKKWGYILKSITDRDIPEVKAIQLLCSLLENCQTFCTEEAIEATSKVKTDEASVKKGWQMKSAKEEPRMSLEAYFESEDEKAIWAEYMKRCFECCWHMARTDPPLVLRFPEPGDDQNKKLFDDYTTQDDCYNESIPEGRVVCVAWPAVVQAQTKCKYAKGMVVLSDGKAPEIVESNTNTDQDQEVKWHQSISQQREVQVEITQHDQDSSEPINCENGQQSAGSPDIEPLKNTSQQEGQSVDSPVSPPCLITVEDDHEQQMNGGPDTEQHPTIDQQKDQLKPDYQAGPEQTEDEYEKPSIESKSHETPEEKGDQPEVVPCDEVQEDKHDKTRSGNIDIEQHENTSQPDGQCAAQGDHQENIDPIVSMEKGSQ